jgi:hypothetical protein
MAHRDIKSTLRYKACILPEVTSPLDPESRGMIVRQMNVLLTPARGSAPGRTVRLPTWTSTGQTFCRGDSQDAD